MMMNGDDDHHLIIENIYRLSACIYYMYKKFVAGFSWKVFFVINMQKSVFRDHPREVIKVVFKSKWFLNAGSLGWC